MIADATGRTLIYDAFVRDGFLYLVSTYWHFREAPITIRVGDAIAEEVGVNELEPVRYFRVSVGSSSPPTEIQIDDVTYSFKEPVPVLAVKAQNKGLAVATLFKQDHKHIPSMIEWYRAHGVDDFYLYYNGTELPAGLPTGPGIHYGLWPFRYWHPGTKINKKETGWMHAAQPAFITMITLRYMPDHSWMGLVDIDEHVCPVTADLKLCDVLADVSSGFDVVKVRNYYAIRNPDSISFGSESQGGWTHRTKCFYRGSFRGLCGIHQPKTKCSILECESLRMLHMANYLSGKRFDERANAIVGEQLTVAWPKAKAPHL
jgi:hypothetical protein